MAKGNRKREVVQQVEPHELISKAEVEQIRKTLIESHADLVVQGMLDDDVRAQLEMIVRKDFKQATKGNPDVITYVVRETIGTGIIEDILQSDDSITDIGFNGTELVIETNDSKVIYDQNFEVTDDYIIRLVNKFANANNKEFTTKNPIFDGRFRNVRINAVHADNTAPESGTTMSLRVVRPRLALTEDNFEGFAPKFMLDFFEAAALTKANMVIAGITGTGKTELHKLISGYIPFDHRIILIEDTPETFMKEMFPDKDVYSWVTSESVSVTQLIKAGLRNHPVWMMVTETRGSEAYEMVQAVLSGHSIITSLHATSARAIPTRFVNMAKMGYQLSEEALIHDIRQYFHFGIHIKKAKFHGHVVRYLSEVIEFNPEGDKTIFKQRFVNGVFTFETFDLSDEFKEMMEESMVDLDFPAGFKSERPLDTKNTTFQASIPLDRTGRPDYRKIKAMGTTLEVLMGRKKTFHNPADSLDTLEYETNKEGYIAPNVGNNHEDVNENRINKLKEQAEKKLKQQAKAPQPAPAVQQTTDDIDADLQRIVASVNTGKNAQPKPAKRPPAYAPSYKRVKDTRSIDQLLAEKRELVQGEHV